MTLEQRVHRLEALVEILLDENSILKTKFSDLAFTSDIEEHHKKLINGWKAHPDGDFDKTYNGSLGCIVDTEYRDRHIFKEEQYGQFYIKRNL